MTNITEAREDAIDEAKRTYASGLIDQADLETRVGHLARDA